MNMSQLQPLDKVIRKVDAATKANSSTTEKVVTLDRKTGETTSGLKRLVGGNLVYYLVANTNDDSNVAECKGLPCTLKDFANDRQVAIYVNYLATCSPRNEERVAKALCSDKTPSEQLAAKIQNYIDKFSRSSAADFIENYSINKLRELENFIKNQVEQEVGLNFDLRLALAYEEQLKPFSTGLIQFTVQLRDCNDDLDLQLKIELIVDEQNKVKALANFGKEVLLVNFVEEEVKKYLLENVTLHQFCYRLQDIVQRDIFTCLNKSLNLSGKGRKVRFLWLASTSVSSLPPEILEIEYEVECKYQGYPEPKPILVKNIVQMLLEDIGKYRLARISDLNFWAKSKLERFVKPLLLNKEYINILLDFETIASEIKQAMEQEAETIGYTLKQIVSRPNLKLLDVIKGFDLEIEEGNFATKDANVKVKLNTFVSGKIDKPREIKDDLSPEVDLEGLMKRTVYNAMREVLNSIEPERYYLRFNFPAVDERGNPIEKSVEQELTDKINEVLEKRFHAKLSTIIPKPLNTEITESYQELFQKIGSFAVEVESLRGGELVNFEGNFQVLGVEKNSWYMFQSRQPRINDIKLCIEKSFKAKLSTFANEHLQYTDIKELSVIEAVINKWGRDSVVDQFGLEISISNLSRTRTKVEHLRSNAWIQLQEQEIEDALSHLQARKDQQATLLGMATKDNQAKLSELSKLYEQRDRILASPDNEEELEELNKKINALKKEAMSPSVEDAKTKLNHLEPKTSKELGFLDIAESMNILPSKNNPAIAPDSETNVSEKGSE